jgi:hypothetical protein
MMGLSSERRDQLLRDLQNLGSGQAEAAPAETRGRYLLPVPEHVRALEPEVILVVGDRGSGKSELFHAATDPELLSALARLVPGARLGAVTREHATWYPAFPLERYGPDARGWASLALVAAGDREEVQALWFAYLVRTLRDELSPEWQEKLACLLSAPGGDGERCRMEFEAAHPSPLLALDALDERLERENRYVFVAYDELDTLVVADWDALGTLVRELVSFWAQHSRRWRRIRAKLFVRSDLYRRVDMVGADFVKLAANRAELVWSDKNLYAMLAKRIVNRSEALAEYCRSKLETTDDPVLGNIPVFRSANDARPLVERLVGPYMGANARKGLSFHWLLDHIRDGNGRAMPRALVRLVELAAGEELRVPQASGMQLLHPVSLRKALDEVSRQHVQGLTDLFPWQGLKERLERAPTVPWERREVTELLRAGWDGYWGERGIRPPASTPRELVDYLIEIGVFRLRRGGAVEKDRIDVPDLFLAGFGLKRKGGVRRK